MNRNAVTIALCMVVLFAISGLLIPVAWGADWDTCSVPSSAVVITVKQDGDKPIYEFAVKNLHNEAIYSFSIGRGIKGGLRRLKEFFPVEVASPEGWEGGVSASESPTLHYFWHIDKPEDYSKFEIKPGKTLSGFRLVMSEPVDIIKVLPFKVLFNNLKCAQGTIVYVQ